MVIKIYDSFVLGKSVLHFRTFERVGEYETEYCPWPDEEETKKHAEQKKALLKEKGESPEGANDA